MRFLLAVSFAISLFGATSGYAAQQRLSPYDAGRRNFEAGNYVRAIELFAQAIAQSGDNASKARAYYFQGLTLFEMGHYYSSYVAFRSLLALGDEVGREVYEKAIKNAVNIGDRLYMVSRVGKILEQMPVASVPPTVLAHYHYAVGTYRLENGNPEGAEANFKAVHPESPFYPKSLFFLGVISTKQKNYQEAVYYNEKTLELTRGRKDQYQMQELARLNLARSAYSGGDVERSISMYSDFLSSSPHWMTVLLEASWPLMRVNDTTVSLGNLHTLMSPFYREDMVGEAYVLRSTILFSLCKYEEMRQTLALFFELYDPVLKSMQAEEGALGSPDAFIRAFENESRLNRPFINFAKRDPGVQKLLRVIEMLKEERDQISGLGKLDIGRKLVQTLDESERSVKVELGAMLQRLHRRKLLELQEQREQANYLKVEIVTGEKELIETQKGLPSKREVDVETTVAAGYNYWPFNGEFWEDELGTFVYTSESSCVN